jgi:hypothetical protein
LSGGRSGAAASPDKDEFIVHVQRLAAGEAADYECQRRRMRADWFERLRCARKEQSVLLVEAPVAVMSQHLESLPEGVDLNPGEIRIHFTTPFEALEKLLALALAVGNNQTEFERIVAR